MVSVVENIYSAFAVWKKRDLLILCILLYSVPQSGKRVLSVTKIDYLLLICRLRKLLDKRISPRTCWIKTQGTILVKYFLLDHKGFISLVVARTIVAWLVAG